MSDDLAQLVADLHFAADDAMRQTRQIVSKGALNIKNETRDAWAWHRLFPKLFMHVSYDLADGEGMVSAEIGPTLGMAGSLGGIIEEGTVNNAGHHTMARALEGEAPAVDKWMGDMGERLLDGR